MKILITGIHGFVGSNLVKALSSNNEIYGLDIISPTKKGIIKTFSWNDLDHGKIPQVDAVIHLAGKAHDTKNQSKADVYFQVNTELTKRIYNWFCSNQAYKFIFFSSVKAAADFVPGEILSEDVIPAPVGPYGESKIKAEEYLQSHACWKADASVSNEINKQVYILRPCMIHGPGNKGNLNLLYQVVRKGIPWPLGAFENKRTFTSIDNLTFVIKGLLSNPVESGIYHMADDEALSTNELIQIICCTLQRNAHIWRMPQGLIFLCAKCGDILHLPLNTFRLNKLTENYVVSNAKIKQALHIEQMPVRAKDGLIKTIKSFQ